MSLVGQVGRKRPRARFAMFMIYLALCLGALTTLYPFGLMVSTSFKGPTDQNDNKLMPQYFGVAGTDQTDFSKPGFTLFAKYLDDKYASDLAHIQSTRIAMDANGDQIAKYEEMLEGLPNDAWAVGFRQAPGQVTSKLNLRYQQWLKARFPSIQALNDAYVEENVAFTTVTPPAELLDRKGWKPRVGQKSEDWAIFKATLPVEFRIPLRRDRLWQEFARGRAEGQFKRVAADVAGGAKGFEGLTFSAAARQSAWGQEFLATRLPESLKTAAAEDQWARVSTEPMPIGAYERAYVRRNESELRREFVTRNYRYVLSYLLLNGRAVLNTVIFCGLMILTQLIVNPLAAYALSRYPIRASGKILLFLLATMAFPAEVAMIPSFLLLKDLHLLNTFAALVLPAAASGYMIFLLKGFFDSLPQELYESGQIDGAKETTMMWKIALPLSRPVLGYLALMAFMGAYGAFIFAFLIAQDRSMWTLMVSIYQLQLVAPKAIVMAALTIAALPTLMVFLAAQRVIMRGIVLPGER